MLGRATGSVLVGVEAVLVGVEVYITSGLPTFTIVGLPDTSVSEARDRVRAAIRHAGEDFPQQRITVNLAPSDVRKQGPGLDLAIALAVLAASTGKGRPGLEGRLVMGELGLGGEVRSVRGALAGAEVARLIGLRDVLCPAPNAREAALAGLPVLAVQTLRDAIAVSRGRAWDTVSADAEALLAEPSAGDMDLAQIRDQQQAKRALEIAAAGGHNMLLSGPPGSGKTLLARALPGVLPRLTVPEALEVTRIHSAAGLLATGEALVRSRPFRAPHHGISVAGMVGGGSSYARPGEISLAHRGVLFLDELPEFPRSCLEALRQPLEDGRVTVVRAKHVSSYPARFQLVAAMNPCPCGHFNTDVPCRCTPHARHTYRFRLSGPLLDRIDMHLQVPRVKADKLLDPTHAETSDQVRKRVEAARLAGQQRGEPYHATCNAELPAGSIVRAARPTPPAMSDLSRCANLMRLSGRGIHRMLRVARTIADLEGRDQVTEADVKEAVQFRMVEASVREDAS